VTRVQLLFKLTHVLTTYVEVIGVTKLQGLIVMYVIMKQMHLNCSHRCNDATIICDDLVFGKKLMNGYHIIKGKNCKASCKQQFFS
jgi:hypothetical protein